MISGWDSCYLFDLNDDAISLVYRVRQQNKQVPALFPPLDGFEGVIHQKLLLTDKFLWTVGGQPGKALRINLENGKIEPLNLPREVWLIDHLGGGSFNLGGIWYLNCSPDEENLIVGGGNKLRLYKIVAPKIDRPNNDIH